MIMFFVSFCISGIKRQEIHEMTELNKIFHTNKIREDAHKELNAMFETLEEGILLISQDKIEFQNEKFNKMINKIENIN